MLIAHLPRESMSEDLQMIVASVDRVLGREDLNGARRDLAEGIFPAAVWNALVEIGLPLLLVPEDAGGIGAGLEAAVAVSQLVGRHAAPVPLAETMLANALRARYRLPLDSRPATMALPLEETSIEASLGATGLHLRGLVPGVAWAAQSSVVLLVHGARLIALPSDRLTLQPGANLAHEPRDTLVFDASELPASSVMDLLPGDTPTSLLARAALLRAAEIAGAMAGAFEMTRQYAADRRQFGKPLAGFQVIQHHLATIAGQVAASDIGTRAAARDFDADGGLLGAAAAKAQAASLAGSVAALTHQIHGAMGFTKDHGLHVYTTRLWSWRDDDGSEFYWSEWLGRDGIANGSTALWAQMARDA